MFLHQYEQRHGPHVAPDLLELSRHLWIGTIEEEGVHVDDVHVSRQVTEYPVLILELDSGLGHQRNTF